MSRNRERRIAETNEEETRGLRERADIGANLSDRFDFHRSSVHDSSDRLLVCKFEQTTDVDFDQTPLQDYPSFFRHSRSSLFHKHSNPFFHSLASAVSPRGAGSQPFFFPVSHGCRLH